MPERLTESLIRQGLLDPDRAREALQRQVLLGGALDTCLLELRLVDEPALVEAMASAYGLATATANDVITALDARASRVFPEQWARKHTIAPLWFDIDRGLLTVLSPAPPDVSLLFRLGELLELQIRPLLAPEYRVHQRLSLLYGLPPPERFRALIDHAGEESGPHAHIADHQQPVIVTRPLTFGEAVTRLKEARDRDSIVRTALAYANRDLELAAMFIVHDRRLEGWMAVGDGSDRITGVSLELDVESAFRVVLETQAHYLGPLPDDQLHRRFLSQLDRPHPRASLIVPVRIKNRTIALMYGENGPSTIPPRLAADLMLFTTHVQGALEALLLRKKVESLSEIPASSRPASPAMLGVPLETVEIVRPGSSQDVAPAEDAPVVEPIVSELPDEHVISRTAPRGTDYVLVKTKTADLEAGAMETDVLAADTVTDRRRGTMVARLAPTIEPQRVEDVVLDVPGGDTSGSLEHVVFPADPAGEEPFARDDITVRERIPRDIVTEDPARLEREAREAEAREAAMREAAIREQAMRDAELREQRSLEEAARRAEALRKDRALEEATRIEQALREAAALEAISRGELRADPTLREHAIPAEVVDEMDFGPTTLRDVRLPDGLVAAPAEAPDTILLDDVVELAQALGTGVGPVASIELSQPIALPPSAEQSMSLDIAIDEEAMNAGNDGSPESDLAAAVGALAAFAGHSAGAAPAFDPPPAAFEESAPPWSALPQIPTTPPSGLVAPPAPHAPETLPEQSVTPELAISILEPQRAPEPRRPIPNAITPVVSRISAEYYDEPNEPNTDALAKAFTPQTSWETGIPRQPGTDSNDDWAPVDLDAANKRPAPEAATKSNDDKRGLESAAALPPVTIDDELERSFAALNNGEARESLGEDDGERPSFRERSTQFDTAMLAESSDGHLLGEELDAIAIDESQPGGEPPPRPKLSRDPSNVSSPLIKDQEGWETVQVDTWDEWNQRAAKVEEEAARKVQQTFNASIVEDSTVPDLSAEAWMRASSEVTRARPLPPEVVARAAMMPEEPVPLTNKSRPSEPAIIAEDELSKELAGDELDADADALDAAIEAEEDAPIDDDLPGDEEPVPLTKPRSTIPPPSSPPPAPNVPLARPPSVPPREVLHADAPLPRMPSVPPATPQTSHLNPTPVLGTPAFIVGGVPIAPMESGPPIEHLEAPPTLVDDTVPPQPRVRPATPIASMQMRAGGQMFDVAAPVPAPPIAAETAEAEPPSKMTPVPVDRAIQARTATLENEINFLIERLGNPDVKARRAARDALTAMGPYVLPKLIERFPGQVTIDPFSPATTLLPFADCSELLSIVASFGLDAHPYVVRRLDSAIALQRFFATYFYAVVFVPEAIPRLVQRLHDEEPRICMLTARTLFSYRELPEFQAVIEHLHGRLEATSVTARRHAAYLIGLFRDVSAVPLLIDVFDRKEKSLYDAVEGALAEITKQRLGPHSKKWRAWWARNESRSRIGWLIDGLGSKEAAMRRSAAEELRAVTGIDFGYDEDAPRKSREDARMRWEKWWRDQYNLHHGMPDGDPAAASAEEPRSV